MNSENKDHKTPKVSITQRLDEAIERGDQAPPSLLNQAAWGPEE